ncbi:hypothetical protein ACSX1A_05735 [Pontibacter sp. MBLB2868]|uniref:hypothetical protein n=1 Tax=Pontibacter sp. MBLB2868 TaxID=3451555 RepID=UPI003F754D76
MWEIEEIPDIDTVHCRVHKQFYSSKTKKPSASAFRNTPEDGTNLSSDWSKYASAIDCRNFVSKLIHHKTGNFRNPEDYVVYSFSVKKLRELNTIKQQVLHDPIFNDPEREHEPNNRAHSIIEGSKGLPNDNKFRLEMVELGYWSIDT